MSISVEQCKDFKDNTCTKCGRMLPDVCKAQEDIEEKARKFDELMAKQAAEEAPGHTDLMVSPESIEDLIQEEEETEVPLDNAPAAQSIVGAFSAKPVKGVPMPKRKL